MNEFIILIFRTVLVVILLTIAMKIMGKREVGQLSIFDFLIVLSVADIMIICIENFEDSMWYSLIPLVIIVAMQKLVSFIDLKIPRFRTLVEGKEKIIIDKGVVDLEVMKKEHYNMNDLYTQLREKNIRSITDVEYAVLEVNGNLSVFTYSENVNTMPIPLIVSGVIDEVALSKINKDLKWLRKELKKQNIDNLKSVYGASFENDKLVIVKTKKVEKKK